MSSYAKATSLAGTAIVVLVVAMVVFESRVSYVAPGIDLKDGKLTQAQSQSLAAALDLVKLLMNWALAVIGATGFFLKLNVEKDIPILKRDLVLAFVIILLSVGSLFLGHLVIDKSAEILALEQFPLNNEPLRRLGRYQYLAGLGAIALFGFHVFQFFWARASDGQNPVRKRGP